jgi:hypothetical protein
MSYFCAKYELLKASPTDSYTKCISGQNFDFDLFISLYVSIDYRERLFFSVITYDLTVFLIEIPDQRIKQVIEIDFLLLNLDYFIEKKFYRMSRREEGVDRNRT